VRVSKHVPGSRHCPPRNDARRKLDYSLVRVIAIAQASAVMRSADDEDAEHRGGDHAAVYRRATAWRVTARAFANHERRRPKMKAKSSTSPTKPKAGSSMRPPLMSLSERRAPTANATIKSRALRRARSASRGRSGIDVEAQSGDA